VLQDVAAFSHKPQMLNFTPAALALFVIAGVENLLFGCYLKFEIETSAEM